MGAIIGLVVLLLLSLIGFIVAGKLDHLDDGEANIAKGFGWVFLGIFAIVFIITSVTSVEARTIGVVTAFGKPVGEPAKPGLNWVWPWTDVTEFSTANQTIDFDGTDGNGSPVGFKLAADKDGYGGGEATVHVNITWQVQDDKRAQDLWSNWKEFDRVKDQLVDKNSRAIIGALMGQYSSEEANKGVNYSKFADNIKSELNKFFADKGIRVETVAVMRVDFSPQVQDRINKKYQDQQDVQRAQIQQDKAKVEAQTREIQKQNLDPLTLQLKCLELTNAWNDDNNGQLPPGWNCFGPVGVSVGK